MSKIAEQKALEAYPKAKEEPYSTGFINKETLSSSKREGYIVGYDQAMQDFLEKAEKVLTERMYFSDDEAKEFKNYMQDESEN